MSHAIVDQPTVEFGHVAHVAVHFDDLDAFVAYRRERAVARYQSWDETFSRHEAEDVLDRRELGVAGEWLQLALTARQGGALLGDCGVHVLADQPATAELGITLAPASQGRGIAREALGALITTLFARHGMHRVYAQADDRNGAVHRVLARLRDRRPVDARDRVRRRAHGHRLARAQHARDLPVHRHARRRAAAPADLHARTRTKTQSTRQNIKSSERQKKY